MKIKEARALMAEGVLIDFSIHLDNDSKGNKIYQLLLLTAHGGGRMLQTFRGQDKVYKTLDAVVSDIEYIQGAPVYALNYHSVKEPACFKQDELF